jgi:hypothetical protein
MVNIQHLIPKFFGGKFGATAIAGTAAIAFFEANTTATLDRVKIVDAEIPIQALSSGNLTAAVNILSIFLSTLIGHSLLVPHFFIQILIIFSYF